MRRGGQLVERTWTSSNRPRADAQRRGAVECKLLGCVWCCFAPAHALLVTLSGETSARRKPRTSAIGASLNTGGRRRPGRSQLAVRSLQRYRDQVAPLARERLLDDPGIPSQLAVRVAQDHLAFGDLAVGRLLDRASVCLAAAPVPRERGFARKVLIACRARRDTLSGVRFRDQARAVKLIPIHPRSSSTRS